MYKIILVDDEEEIRLGMLRKIKWNELGFEVVGTASNGIEALDLVEKLTPNVILTDIQMPYMDGLEFLEEAIKLVPSVKKIIFSGYDVFEYAQRAITLHVDSYVLKPFSLNEISDILSNLKITMDREWEEKRNLEMLQDNYEESFEVMRNSFLLSSLSGNLSKSLSALKVKQLGLKFDSNYICCVVLDSQHSNISPLTKGLFEGREELIPLAIRQIVESSVGKERTIYSVIIGEQVAVLVTLNDKLELGYLINKFNDVCRESQEVVSKHVVAGMGGIYNSFYESRYSYREAHEALSYSFLLNSPLSFTTYIRDVEKTSTEDLVFSEEEERAVINAVKFGGLEKIESIIDELFSKLESLRPSVSQYQLYLLQIVTVLSKIIRACDLETKDKINDELIILSEKIKIQPIHLMKQSLKKIACTISERLQFEVLNSSKAIINKSQFYIENHFNESDLSVEKLSNELGLSPTYFSTLFKKEIGISFINYLTDIRLAYAIKLLETTDDKTYIISEKIGYIDPNYFSYVFKKKFGVPPTKYRKINKK